MVCQQDFEVRHPQDFVRVRGDDPTVPWTRPDKPDDFIFICYLWDRSAYADLGTADCMRADFTPMTYEQLLELRFSSSYQSQGTAIPGFAIPGLAIPGQDY